MKLVVLLLYIFSFIQSHENLSVLRTEFHQIKTHEQIKEFIEKYDTYSEKKATPYIAAATMKRAEFVFFPHEKLKYFNQGKKMLEEYIKKYPNCIDGRYIRVIVQKNAPGILNYKKNVAQDKKYIKNNISGAELPIPYKNMILKNIN